MVRLRILAEETEERLGPDHPLVRQLKLRIASPEPISSAKSRLRAQLADAVKRFGRDHARTRILQRMVSFAELNLPSGGSDGFLKVSDPVLTALNHETADV